MRALFSIIQTIALIISFLILTACSSENKSVIKPKVFDEAGILKKNTIKAIENKFAFPPDVALYIRTVKTLPLIQIGSIANEMMEKENYWKEIRPKNWYKSRIQADPPHSTGIYILISQNPRLIQVRYGPQIRMEAYRAGLAAGQDYLAFQQKYLEGNRDKVTLHLVKWLEESMPKALILPWYLKANKNVEALSVNEFEDFVFPGDGLYTNWLFKPYLYFASKGTVLTQKAWVIPVITALIYWMIRLVVVTYLLGFLLKWCRPAITNSVKYLTTVALSIFLTFPAIGSIFMLSQGRFEDRLALSQLGIHVPQGMNISPILFGVETSFVIVAGAVLLKLVNDSIGNAPTYLLSKLPDELQAKLYEYNLENNPALFLLHATASSSDFVTQDNLEKKPYTELSHYFFVESLKSSAKWFAFLLLMPKAISLYALATFVLPLPYKLLTLKTAHNDYQKVTGKA